MKKMTLIIILIFILITGFKAFALERPIDELSYEDVYSNINNKQFLQNYPHHITDFAYHNYVHYEIKKDFNKINKLMECLSAIYANNSNWHDIISKINYYREMAILSNIISKDASIQYYKKFLYIVYKAEDGLISGKLNIRNLDEEIYTYRFTAIKILTVQENDEKCNDKPQTIIELQKKSKSLKNKLYSDQELIKNKDINDLY